MIWFWMVLGLGFLTAAVLAWRFIRPLGREIRLERARELFLLQRERLEAQFVDAAIASGKPRGLRWKNCEFEPQVEFARDRSSGQVAALVGVTIQFEAVEGGDMEGLPAVGNLRNASAVFFLQGSHWLTVGKAIFNLNPAEAITHFGKQYDHVSTGADQK